MPRKKLNKRFEEMLTLASKPSVEAKRKLVKKRPDDYTEKQIHPHNVEDVSDSRNDKSH